MLCNWKFLGVSVLRANKSGIITIIGKISAIAFLLCRQSIASGQIIPDSTLPTSSTVTPNGNTLIIEGGTPIGGNLFHSFQEFSLPTGTEAYFNNSLTIENILTRVTGGSISNIDGILRANGAANLFLLNPNGIVFGPNAALNIGGSFFASTADSLRLSDGSDFSATSPNAPPLLTINVPLGLQLGPSPGKIINQSRASNSNGNTVGLSVQPGETIGLVGGDISIEGGAIDAPVGKIQLISLADGFWEFGQEQNSSLESVPIGNSQFGNIELTRESNVSTSGAGGGSIDIVAGKLSVRDGSQLTAITQGDQAGGGLRINAVESVEVIGNSADGLEPSRISSQTQGAGSAGDLTIETSNLTVNDGIISAATFASGAGGNLTVRATSSVELVGGTVDGIFRGLVNAALATGDAGDLTVETGRLIVRNGGFIFSGNRNEGNGGNLFVTATEKVEVSGTSTDGTLPSTIQSAASSGSELVQMRFGESFPRGNAGDLRIETGSLIVTDGAEISAGTNGSGNSGNLTIVASESVEVRGTSGDGQLVSNLATDITGAGAGGNLTIETGRLLLAEGGYLSASTFGAGAGGDINVRASESVELRGTGFEQFERDFIASFVNETLTEADRTTGLFALSSGSGASGDVTIETTDLMLKNGSIVSALTFGSGTGGRVAIRAEKVDALGSMVTASTVSDGAGGDIEIDTAQLLLRDGALLGNSSVGSGDSGNILVRASEKVELSSTPAGAIVGTGMFAQSFGGTGAGGNIQIDTGRLIVRDGARVSASSGLFTGNDIIRTGGAGANIEAIATEEVEIAGMSPDGQFRSALSSTTYTSAPAGKVTVNTGRLIVRDGAEISTSAFGDGAGGDVTVRASEEVAIIGVGFEDFRQNINQRFFDGTLRVSDRITGVFAGTAGVGAAGNITINTQQLTVANGAIVSALTFGLGQGGRIAIQANKIETSASGIGASTLGSGAAGNIEIDTAQLIVRDGAIIAASTIDEGAGGNIVVRASESVELSSALASALFATGIFSDTFGGTGAGGNIEIDTARLSIADGASLSTRTGLLIGDSIINVGGKGRNIEVRASESVEVSGVSGNFRSQVSAASFSSGDAGQVRISTRNLTVRDGAEISVATLGSGQGGSLTIEASETVLLTGRSGDGRFTSSLLAASGDPALATQPTGAAGDLTIIGGDLLVTDGATVAVNSLGSGNAGALTAIAGKIILDDRSTMTASPNAAQGGNINLTAPDLQLRRNSGISTDAGASDGGNITIETDNLAALENSDISANALAGFGGRVSINAEGIFGTSFRERQTPKSDITATSQLGPQFSGVVEINTPEVDPGAGLVKLPETVVDITALVARDPCHHKDESEFIITGRGGLPPSPLDPLSNPVMAIEWATREAATSAGVSRASNTRASNARASNARASNARARGSDSSNSTAFSREEQSTEREYFVENRHPENRHSENRHIIEATGWRVDEEGNIILTADSPNLAPRTSGLTAPSCGQGR
ncbi:MAG: filamentous hemagglutinin N-terminal domain-containing protein [Oscillatoria sp. SIO1A7]|nr:filamentous hemagglutinin N-terminal domain-containing protein [Oscillatoria sp. SIO1A7]